MFLSVRKVKLNLGGYEPGTGRYFGSTGFREGYVYRVIGEEGDVRIDEYVRAYNREGAIRQAISQSRVGPIATSGPKRRRLSIMLKNLNQDLVVSSIVKAVS